MEQLHKIVGDANMRILTIDGYLYTISLDKDPKITEIEGDEWEDLMHHYGLHFYDMIMVHFEECREFLKAKIYGENMRPKNLISAPTRQVNYQQFPFDIQGK